MSLQIQPRGAAVFLDNIQSMAHLESSLQRRIDLVTESIQTMPILCKAMSSKDYCKGQKPGATGEMWMQTSVQLMDI